MTVVMPGAAGTPTSDKARTPVALASTHALPQVAIDELWRRHQPRIIAGWPLPSAPSDVVVEEILSDGVTVKANTELACALAVVIENPDHLDRLIDIASSDEVAAHAARNPHLSAAKRASMPFTSATVTGSDPEHVAARRFLSADVPAIVSALHDPSLKDAMLAQIAAISSMVRPSKPELLDAMLSEVFPSQSPISVSAVGSSDNICNQWYLRHLRGAVLKAVHADTSLLAECGQSVAATGRLVDPYAVEAVDAAVTAGLVPDVESVTLSAHAAARAEVVCQESSPLRSRSEAPRVAHKRKPKAEALNIADSDQDLYLAGLELLGLSDAAARIAISSGDLSDDEFASRLADADAQTIVDWAERRLAQQPSPGKVAEVIDELDASRQKEILDEVRRRPNPLELQPELALCLPEATLIMMDDRSAVFIGVTANRALGSDRNAWSLAIQLLVQGWEPSVLELIRSVEAIVNPS